MIEILDIYKIGVNSRKMAAANGKYKPKRSTVIKNKIRKKRDKSYERK